MQNNHNEKNQQIDLVKKFIESNYTLRFNTLRERTEIYEKEGWSYLSDRDVNTIYISLIGLNIDFPKGKLITLLDSEWVKNFNPIDEWVESLKKWNVDEHPDHIEMLTETINVRSERKELFRKWFKKWLVASLATWLERDVNHTCLILSGPKNIGKTKWLNKLVPKELSDYIYVGSIKANNKPVIRDNLLINLDELASMTERGISRLKSLITREFVGDRKTYGRYAQRTRRLASFCGSVNLGEIFTDTTGDRHFFVFSCTDIQCNHLIDMNDVFSQVYYLLNNGFVWRSEKDENVKIAENYKSTEKIEEIISLFYRVPESSDFAVKMTATEIANTILSSSKSRFDITTKVPRLGRALNKLGFQSVFVNGKKYYKVVRTLFIFDSSHPNENTSSS